jgi:hypothetical protein
MGWTHTYKNWKTIQEFFENNFTSSDESKIKFEVLDSSLVNRVEAYAAVKQINLVTGTEEVFAVTYLVKFMRGYFDFGYKSMDETCGPGMYNCPERIMKLLTPTTYEYAIEWRKTMWEKINERKKLCKQLKIGAYFYMDFGKKDESLLIVRDRNVNYIYCNYVFVNNERITFSNLFRLKMKQLTNYNIKYIPAKDLDMKLKELNV